MEAGGRSASKIRISLVYTMLSIEAVVYYGGWWPCWSSTDIPQLCCSFLSADTFILEIDLANIDNVQVVDEGRRRREGGVEEEDRGAEVFQQGGQEWGREADQGGVASSPEPVRSSNINVRTMILSLGYCYFIIGRRFMSFSMTWTEILMKDSLLKNLWARNLILRRYSRIWTRMEMVL